MLHSFKNIKRLSFLSPVNYLSNKGFSLVELMATIAIISVLSTIVLLNQSTYSEAASLQNLADDIALEIAVVQSFSTSVRELVPGSGDFTTNYGVSFSLRSGNDGSATSYVVFADLGNSPNGRYDGDFVSCTGECLRKVDLPRGNVISNICQIAGTNNENCSPNRKIDIVFMRPNLQPQIRFSSEGGSNVGTPSNRTGGRVKLESPNGLGRDVTIFFSGQVTVQ